MKDTNQPAWTLGRCAAPRELSADRAWIWCILRTLRDARRARDRGRPVAQRHLERLFARRWHEWYDVLTHVDKLDKQWFLMKLDLGRHLIGKGKK